MRFRVFFFAFVALLKNQQHPTYGLGKVRTTGGSDNTARRTEEYHRTGEMGGEWVRAAGWGGVVYSMALCSCGRMAPCGGMGGGGRGRGDAPQERRDWNTGSLLPGQMPPARL